MPTKPYVTVCVENTLADCTDGKDNDGDGRADCFDSDCGRLAGSDLELIRDFCGAEAEDTQERCSDGIDNDLNGYTDCDDFSCSRNENQALYSFAKNKPPKKLQTNRASQRTATLPVLTALIMTTMATPIVMTLAVLEMMQSPSVAVEGHRSCRPFLLRRRR